MHLQVKGYQGWLADPWHQGEKNYSEPPKGNNHADTLLADF